MQAEARRATVHTRAGWPRQPGTLPGRVIGVVRKP